jgi:hypothetical protein
MVGLGGSWADVFFGRLDRVLGRGAREGRVFFSGGMAGTTMGLARVKAGLGGVMP